MSLPSTKPVATPQSLWAGFVAERKTSLGNEDDSSTCPEPSAIAHHIPPALWAMFKASSVQLNTPANIPSAGWAAQLLHSYHRMLRYDSGKTTSEEDLLLDEAEALIQVHGTRLGNQAAWFLGALPPLPTAHDNTNAPKRCLALLDDLETRLLILEYLPKQAQAGVWRAYLATLKSIRESPELWRGCANEAYHHLAWANISPFEHSWSLFHEVGHGRSRGQRR
jgi:hypothetical protein